MRTVRFFPTATLAFLVLVLAGNISAAVFTVTNTNDSGPGSLRQAILDANINNQDDTINFDPGVFNTPRVIMLTSGELLIRPDDTGGTVRTLRINGTGANMLEINGSDHSRIFYIGSLAQTAIDGVKLTGGNGTSNGEIPDINANGGAIRIDNTLGLAPFSLVLTNSIVTGNRATHNSGSGGGIINFGSLMVANCAIVNNVSTFIGGGLATFGTARVFNSTVSRNTARQNAGVYYDGPLFELVNSVVVLNNTTIQNEVDAGIKVISNQFSNPSFNPRNSIIAMNTMLGGPARDVSGQVRSRGSNIFGTSTGISMIEPAASDILNVDPGVSFGLSTNGGIIPSHALRAGSPAIDTGDNCVLVTMANGGCYDIAVTHDHRGVVRPQDADMNGTATVDRGTFEVLATELGGVPGTPDLQAIDDSGISNSDNITATPQVTLDVSGLTIGATVELLRNGLPIGNATVTATSMSLDDTLTTSGIYVYTARQSTGGVTGLEGGALQVVFDNVGPSGTVVQAVGQADPTRLQPINYTLTFNESVVGFDSADLSFAGSTAGTGSASVLITGESPTFSLAVSGMTSDGLVVVGVTAGGVQDIAGNVNTAIAGGDNSVTLDTTAPSVTINQAAAQLDPTRVTPINFTVVFSEPVTGFANTDVSLTGSTANVGSATRTVTGTGPTYNVAISNVTSPGGTVVASIPAMAVQDAAGNTSLVSTSTDNSVFLDNTSPTVTINQAVGQPDPANTMPINYTVVFSESVTDFNSADILFSGSTLNTTGASATVTGSGTTYNVAIGNLMASNGGILRVSVRFAAAIDAVGNSSLGSTSTDNSVTVDTVSPSVSVNQALGQADPTQIQPINFTAVFSETVTGLQPSDISLAGSTANISLANISVTGAGSVFTISVSGITSSGQVRVSIPAGGAQDSAGNSNLASSSTDNSVTVIVRANVFDFDGDGKTDLGIFRPSVAEWWINRSSTSTTFAAQFGATTDRIAPGDYTGDGKADIAFFRPSSGEWYILRSEDFSFFSFPFGTSTDTPAPADYDNDGKTDAAVFRPSSATWFIRRSSDGGTTIEGFGQSTDIVAPADYDGDGKADIAIYRPSLGQWWINRSTAGVIAFTFGNSSDKPVQGDYTGDGKADVAFFRPSTGEWFVLRSSDFSFYSVPFGNSSDIVAPGDYDGDGRFDTAIFRPSETNWYVDRSTAGLLIQQFGASGDRPIPNAYVP